MRSALTIVTGALCAAVVGGLLDGLVWPGPLLALLRPQLTLLTIVVAVVALGIGARGPATAGLAAGVIGVVLLIPALRAPAPERPMSPPAVRLLVLNLWHRNDDADSVRALIEHERPDAIALLELTAAWQRALAPVLATYRIRAVETAPGSHGVGLYARAHVRAPTVTRLVRGANPVVEAELVLDERTGRLLVVHPPGAILPGHAEAQERELAATARWARAAGPRAVLCGDFNAAPWTRMLRDVLDDASLRAALPGGLFAGSWPALVPPLRVAIDGCLVGREIRARAALGPRVGSDHLPVLVELG